MWWEYDELPSRAPYDWSPATRGDDPDDQLDFHLDLGCGAVRKARLGIDRFPSPAVDLVMDLDLLFIPTDEELNPPEKLKDLGLFGQGRLPFPTGSIESIISHHCLEHIGEGFIRLMDETYRVLKPGGIFRIIVPAFPSRTAIEDPDHKRYFMEGTFETFCGAEDGSHWHESFSVPYTNARFEKTKQDVTPMLPPRLRWTEEDAREMRLTLRKRDNAPAQKADSP